jgi:3-oxoacyl-[acyl-carrier-protein] synthase II
MKKRVVITGMGIISPVALGLEKYWQALTTGVCGVDKISLFDTTGYTTSIAAQVKDFNPEDYIEKKKIKRMDKFVQFAVAAADMAIKDSGLDITKEDPFRVGCIVGSGVGGLETIEKQHSNLLDGGQRKVSPFLIPMLISNMAPGEIAIAQGLKGPNYSVISAW